MAIYKVLQDIEAEDKFLGPLTLKQFIFGGVTATLIYICFFTLTRGVVWLTLILLPFILVFGFLAFPWGRDQPTEVWLLAKIRFFVKPRRRIWDQTGLQELVTITAPKKEEKHLTKDFTQTEVRSRLKALAETIDSRGWAIKNVNENLFAQANMVPADTDRLIDPSALYPQEVPTVDIRAEEDVLDPGANPVAAQLEQMINKSSQQHRSQLLQRMRAGSTKSDASSAEEKPDYWFLNQSNVPGQAQFATAPLDQPIPSKKSGQPTPEELAVLEHLHAQRSMPPPGQSHLKVIQPPGNQPAQTTIEPQQNPSPTTPDPAILNLANNDDWTIATIARQAKKEQGQDDSEVVVPLR